MLFLFFKSKDGLRLSRTPYIRTAITGGYTVSGSSKYRGTIPAAPYRGISYALNTRPERHYFTHPNEAFAPAQGAVLRYVNSL